MKLAPYLHFSGDCAEAMRFYAGVFGVEPGITFTYAQSPMAEQTPPEWRDKIMHTRITVSDTELMASDGPPGGPAQKMQGCTLSINVDDPAEAERIFAALAEGGSVRMAIGETFWAERFGMLTDRFGVAWMVNCEKVRP